MKTSQTVWPLLLNMIAVLVLFVGIAGCGKKEWPRPQLEQDRFYWAQIQHQRSDQCIDIRSRLGGAAANLRFVNLEWMELKDSEDCPDCPFFATGMVRLEDSSPGFKRQDGVVRILFCGLQQGVSYRWRLVGANKHRGLGLTTSAIQFSR